MANQTISQLPAAGALTGAELVPIVQDGGTVQTTVAAIAASPVLTGTFITATSQPLLTNSRLLSTSGTGLSLTDNGAGANVVLALSGAPASLVNSAAGIQVKTDGTTLTARSIQAGTAGLSVADGNGVAANPTVSLTGMPLYLAQSTGVGLLTRTSGNSVGIVTLLGTADEIDVANGTGDSANPTIGLADNAVLPGTQGMVVPKGTTGQRSGSPVNGIVRYNTTTQTFEGYANSAWRDFALTGGVTSFSAGSTGLTPGSATTGAITLGGILIGANGGTGVANTGKTITLGGSLTLSGAHDLTLTQTGATNVTLPTTGTLATLAGAETLTNKTINGSNNTLQSIANSSLTNSSVTYNGVTVALGASGTITAFTTAAATFNNSGLGAASGTTFDGSTARTISYNTVGASPLAGSTSFTTAGTITQGTWNATAIANNYLANSSITINGSSVSLGGSVTVTATASNALTIGTGLSGSSYNGSTPVTIAISNTGVSAATYGSASSVPAIVVNAQGQITSATNTAIAIAASQVTSGTLAVTQGGTNLASYTAGDLLYASATTTLSKLALGAQNYVLTAGSSAPQYTAQSSLAVGTATNIAGGAAGSVPYQTGAGATSLLALGTKGYMLRAGTSAPEWAIVEGGTF